MMRPSMIFAALRNYLSPKQIAPGRLKEIALLFYVVTIVVSAIVLYLFATSSESCSIYFSSDFSQGNCEAYQIASSNNVVSNKFSLLFGLEGMKYSGNLEVINIYPVDSSAFIWIEYDSNLDSAKTSSNYYKEYYVEVQDSVTNDLRNLTMASGAYIPYPGSQTVDFLDKFGAKLDVLWGDTSSKSNFYYFFNITFRADSDSVDYDPLFVVQFTGFWEELTIYVKPEGFYVDYGFSDNPPVYNTVSGVDSSYTEWWTDAKEFVFLCYQDMLRERLDSLAVYNCTSCTKEPVSTRLGSTISFVITVNTGLLVVIQKFLFQSTDPNGESHDSQSLSNKKDDMDVAEIELGDKPDISNNAPKPQ
eukprot:TRINITY_DN8670_c0_g4_i2.p1 TRINITY_DN8670_c0_g4~~TRINITY_DN8670_c0_g4_i2.p1  ORF type:complete len:361 (+),score=80.51 TRINITY_DN8670_c0_g4_i2:403-1485(+)